MVNYLYGDSTPSQLTSNFLEFLRDALDFAVFVLQADERIKAGKAKIAELTEEANAELAALERFVGIVGKSIDDADKAGADSPTAHCASRMSELLGTTQHSFADAVRGRLANDIATIDGEEAATREACVDALGTLMGPHTPPGSSVSQELTLTSGGSYDATITGKADFGLAWQFDLSIPTDDLWASAVRLERIAPQLEIRAPQVTGWISKEVKVRPLRIERYVVTQLVQDGALLTLKLRAEPDSEVGFDVEAHLDRKQVTMSRVGPSDDAAVGAFEVHESDQPLLLDIAQKLADDAAKLERAKLREATFDGEAFVGVPSFIGIVERFISVFAPIVREISARSLTPTELILRRAVADDRREEVFVAKATLREKYNPLSTAQRAMFAPLGLDAEVRGTSVAPPLPAAALKPAARAEISRSQPPPMPSKPLPPPPVPSAPTALSAPAPNAPKLDNKRNEEFVETVKKIVLVLKSGRTDEGYHQYAELLASPSFADYRADDQRQALKLLLLAKAPPAPSVAVTEAYRIAQSRIQVLVDALAEPADYEMLGVAHLQLGDKKSAGAAFDIALKLERARDPSSELCNNLTRRVNQLAALAAGPPST